MIETLVSQVVEDKAIACNRIPEVLAEVTLTFEENLLLGDSGCPRYGCTCISYEKCCGCLLQ